MNGKLWIGAAAAAFICFGCNPGGAVSGSGVEKQDSRTVDKYSKIQVTGNMDVVVIYGSGKPAVTVVGDDNVVPLVTTDVSNGTLNIGMKNHATYTSNKQLFVLIKTADPIGEVSSSGSGQLSLSGLSGGSLKLAETGSGNVQCAGNVDTLDASLTGSGNMNLDQLRAKSATASVGGSGDIDVSVSDTLNATVSGSGSIVYSGTPKITQSVTGSGKVQAKPQPVRPGGGRPGGMIRKGGPRMGGRQMGSGGAGAPPKAGTTGGKPAGN